MARLDAAWFNFAQRNKAWDHFWQDDGPDGPSAPADETIAQARQSQRFIWARIWSRVN